MPGKVNPVIPEAVTQAAMRVMANDVAIGMACASGSLELNPFLPLVADALLESLDLLASLCDLLRRHCVDGIEADAARCRAAAESPPLQLQRLFLLWAMRRPASCCAWHASRGRPSGKRRSAPDG